MYANGLTAIPGMRDAFYLQSPGGWRPPKINETCCVRPALAALLADGATTRLTAQLTVDTIVPAVASSGVDVLYNGNYTQRLADDIRAAGGVVTAEDLRTATAVVQEPIVAEVCNSIRSNAHTVKTPIRSNTHTCTTITSTQVLGMKVYMPPPPSSAVTLVPALNFLAGFDFPAPAAGLDTYHRYGAVDNVHVNGVRA